MSAAPEWLTRWIAWLTKHLGVVGALLGMCLSAMVYLIRHEK